MYIVSFMHYTRGFWQMKKQMRRKIRERSLEHVLQEKIQISLFAQADLNFHLAHY